MNHCTKKLTIEDKIIGYGYPTFIIAEVGVNHNGDIDLAMAMVREAKACGADCVKFQTFRADRVVTKTSPKAAYQLKSTDPQESQLDMLRKLELPEHTYKKLINLCKKEDITFLSTPYSIEDIDFLDTLGVPAFKVASGQAVEPYFLEYMSKRGKPILLSTGMCTLSEVDEAVRSIRKVGNDQIVILQCTTNYPSAIEDTNLAAMQTMCVAFDALVGYSDHTQSLTSSTVAVGLGAFVIERHFTMDKSLPGPDQSNSSDPHEFKMLVHQIRDAEKCLGSHMKFPSYVEIDNAKGMRRSIVSIRHIPKNEIFTYDNIMLKRPANGLSAKMVKFVLGRKAAIDIPSDTVIDFEMIK